MCLSDILIHVRRTDGLPVAVATGLRLANVLDAFVAGVFVVPPDRPRVFTLGEAAAMQLLSSNREFEHAQGCAPWWIELLNEYDVRGEWRVAQGEVIEALGYGTRFADLVVTEMTSTPPDAPLGWGVVERTVFGVGTPVLIVPEAPLLPSLGECILIAWNGSAEASRAVHAALPLLKLAKRVVVLRGDEKHRLTNMRQAPPPSLEAHLGRHGISASFRSFKAEADVAGEAILAAAHEEAADLIVMGAWGHSRWSELILGGASRYLFRKSDIPLLVAH